MTKFARNLTAAIIAIFIVVMMVLLASATLREDDHLREPRLHAGQGTK